MVARRVRRVIELELCPGQSKTPSGNAQTAARKTPENLRYNQIGVVTGVTKVLRDVKGF